MNSMTIFGLSSFSKVPTAFEINYMKFNKKSFILNKRTGFIKLLTNTADFNKNKNMTERSFGTQLLPISSYSSSYSSSSSILFKYEYEDDDDYEEEGSLLNSLLFSSKKNRTLMSIENDHIRNQFYRTGGSI
jgi:hypothetical protein